MEHDEGAVRTDRDGGAPTQARLRAMPSQARLRAALRELPAASPGPEFVARVLGRIEGAAGRQQRPRPRRRPLPAWVSAAAAVAVLVAGLWGIAAGRQAWEQQRHRAALRAESAELARELAALREEAARPAPVLYLGGSEQVDVVLDLSALPIAASAPATSALGGTRR
jgi:hypothetical protein